jgi:hypothetical protein
MSSTFRANDTDRELSDTVGISPDSKDTWCVWKSSNSCQDLQVTHQNIKGTDLPLPNPWRVGEVCLTMAKSEASLVEARSGSVVQIDPPVTYHIIPQVIEARL